MCWIKLHKNGIKSIGVVTLALGRAPPFVKKSSLSFYYLLKCSKPHRMYSTSLLNEHHLSSLGIEEMWLLLQYQCSELSFGASNTHHQTTS